MLWGSDETSYVPWGVLSFEVLLIVSISRDRRLAQFAILEKKAPALQPVHEPLLQVLHPEQVEVEVCRAEALDRRRGRISELDDMWSDVHSKAHPRWPWHALDQHTGTVWA